MISYALWQKLPLGTRVLIAKQFGIAKVGPTHVVDNKLVADGYLFEDVENALSDDAMKTFTSATGDSNQLFEAVISKLSVPQVVQLNVENKMAEIAQVPHDTTVEESMAKPEKIRVIKSPKKKGKK